MYKLTEFATLSKKNTYRLPPGVLQTLHALCASIHAEPIFEFSQEVKQTRQDVIRELNKITENSSFVPFLSILNDENVGEFSEDIFTILTSNAYLMPIYCKLFSELKRKYPLFVEVFQTKTDVYTSSFHAMRFGDPSDYDTFCKINQENQTRKLYSSFIAEMDRVEKTQCAEGISTFILGYMESLLKTNQKDIVYECIEHISMLSKYTLYHKEKIEAYCELNPKDVPGIHNKFIFTCMDILKL